MSIFDGATRIAGNYGDYAQVTTAVHIGEVAIRVTDRPNENCAVVITSAARARELAAAIIAAADASEDPDAAILHAEQQAEAAAERAGEDRADG